MYILRGALRNISRAKGRNILMGIIALVIAVSSCLALSIRESAKKEKEDLLSSSTISAQITMDRTAVMQNAQAADGEFSRDTAASALQEMDAMTLEEYEAYASVDGVASTNYSVTVSLSAGEEVDPVDVTGSFSRTEEDTGTQEAAGGSGGSFNGEAAGGRGSFQGKMGTQGDFTLIGYSEAAAMTNFLDGTASVTEGSAIEAAIFSGTTVTAEDGTVAYACMIHQELATQNELAVGDVFTLCNPNDEAETVSFFIASIYTADSTQDAGIMQFSTATDTANQIYLSAEALTEILENSAAGATVTTDETTGRTTSTAMTSQLAYHYIFATVEDYDIFSAAMEEVLPDGYTISSTDLAAYENSLLPLENLSQMADWFLVVVFAIGAVILIILHIFHIRERKYEIGVLAAMGMKKGKIALQFFTEILVVTMAAMILGAGIGACTSVPVTNALLSSQISANTAQAETLQANFGEDTKIGAAGKDANMGGFGDGTLPQNGIGDAGALGGKGGFMGNMVQSAANYVDSVSYATDLTVVLELLGVGLLLTILSSLTALICILRYEPLQILSNRD